MAKRKGLVRVIEGKDVLRDLKKLARGKEASLPVTEVAFLAARQLEAALAVAGRDRELEQLEAMFLLPDPRTSE